LNDGIAILLPQLIEDADLMGDVGVLEYSIRMQNHLDELGE